MIDCLERLKVGITCWTCYTLNCTLTLAVHCTLTLAVHK